MIHPDCDWCAQVAAGQEPLRVEVLIRLDQQDAALSRWELTVAKPKNVRLLPQSAAILFPRPVSISGTQAAGFAWTDEVYRLLGQSGRCSRSAESPATSVARR